MRKIVHGSIAAAAAIPVCLAWLASAQATTNRTFVSGSGVDAGTCGRSAPCRSFAFALAQTSSAGEIVVLDSAGYGIVSIAQSVTITNPGGVEAGITTAIAGTSGITINASANITVTLRGLTIEGGGIGAGGISVQSSLPNVSGVQGTVNVIDCFIEDFTNNGITIQPTASSNSPALEVVISHSFVTGNGAGLDVDPLGDARVFLQIDQSTFDENGFGVNLAGGTNFISASFVESHADNNGLGVGLTGGGVNLTMKKSTALTSTSGTDISVSGATINLYDDNTVGQMSFSNGGTGNTDGTNNIASGGSSLNKVGPL